MARKSRHFYAMLFARDATMAECVLPLILRSGVGVYHRAALRADPFAASRRMRNELPCSLMVRDGARAPPHHEEQQSAPPAVRSVGAAVHRQHDHLGADVDPRIEIGDV